MKGITVEKYMLVNGTMLLFGLFLIFAFFAAMEEYQVLVAGTATDSITVSVEVLETISISSPSDVTLSPDITGTGLAQGNVTWTVDTSNVAGWKLELDTNASPTMTSGSNSFADYTEAVAGTPEVWSVASGDSEFGFSSGGSYAESEYFNGTRYEGFEGTTNIQVASDSSATPGGGADCNIYFNTEVGSSKSQIPGTYTATVTATATTL